MGFLSKIIAGAVEAVVDTTELVVKTGLDVVAAPLDLGENGELFSRSKEKLKEMQEDE